MRKLTTSKALLAFIAISSIGSTAAYAEESAESAVEVNVGADLVSSYIWRGTDCGSASIQPALGVSYKGFSLSAWGSVGMVNWDDTKELDFTLAYEGSFLSLAVTDYWFSGDIEDEESGIVTRKKYFDYKKSKSSSHVFEGTVGLDFGAFTFAWNTIFAGDDYKITDEGKDKRAYSSYFELGVPFTLGGLDWAAAVGGTPAEGMYADKFAITNISLGATKEIKISDSYSLPISASVIANPHTKDMFFVAGISF